VGVNVIDDQVVVDVGLGHGHDLADGDGAGGNAAAKLGLDLGPIPGLDFVLARPDRGARQRAHAGANRGAGARVAGGAANCRAGTCAQQPAK